MGGGGEGWFLAKELRVGKCQFVKSFSSPFGIFWKIPDPIVILWYNVKKLFLFIHPC